MLEKNYNTIEGKIKGKNLKEEEEKNFKKKLSFLSNTHQDFISKKEKSYDLSHLKNFQGFFNKNFNLTSFKEKQENFRLKSRSPEKIIKEFLMI